MRKLILSLSTSLALAGAVALAPNLGCSTGPVTTAYKAEQGTRIGVQEAMGLYNQLVKAGKVTTDQELKVKAAYEKVQASMIILCDVGKNISSINATNVTGAMQQALSAAVADYAQNLNDLYTLLRSLGVAV